MSRKIYFISGLGANEQVFTRLQLTDVVPVYLKWIIPQKNELIQNYAKRMLQQIDEPNPVLLGLSFGGMIAVEMAKQYPVQHIILVSSVKTRNELPWWMKAAGKLKLHKIIKTKPNPVLYPVEDFFLGAVSDEEKKLVTQFRQNVDDVYLEWAINVIVNWNNVTIPENITHIHGITDKIFPIGNIQADYNISGGGHFMVYNKAEDVSRFINSVLKKYPGVK
ncbi:MAG: alpha/beta hydrolase [Lacibacter sp.]